MEVINDRTSLRAPWSQKLFVVLSRQSGEKGIHLRGLQDGYANEGVAAGELLAKGEVIKRIQGAKHTFEVRVYGILNPAETKAIEKEVREALYNAANEFTQRRC